MRVLVTGARGFLGKNLLVWLRERGDVTVTTFVKGESLEALEARVQEADFIFHLAGVNRPQSEQEFLSGNAELTQIICEMVRRSGRQIPIAYTSSIQATRDNAYGNSKRRAEAELQRLSEEAGVPVYVARLPNVFGKWCRPYYNSVVATFCHNIARGLPLEIHDPSAEISLVYVDDVMASFVSLLEEPKPAPGLFPVGPIYTSTVGDLAKQIERFKESRESLVMERVGTGFDRALYSTFISYYTPDQFAYPLVKHEDPRGVFVEMLKTPDAGQFSFFTAGPGVTRGGHYHHTKTEKFLVLKGAARFRFRQIDTDEEYEYCVQAGKPEVVETIPGWSHDITNISSDEMIVMLWANEIFDRKRPDTVASKV
jgi:UDP-2-acetamido-2,6-beta-L-arabino-hexul-4-ose reductase